MRCLIVGEDGSFGGALSASLKQSGHNAIGTTRRCDRAATGKLFLDLSRPLPALPHVDVAVVCAAMARFDECRQFPDLAHRVNVEAPLELARSLTQAGARVMFLSTSAVFDCRKPYVDEEERPAPRSIYGRLKAEAEAALLGVGSQVSVLRLTKVMKQNSGIFSDWIRKLAEGKAIRAFDDHRFCPLRVEDVVGAIVALIERGQGGVYQVSGAADVSFADVAMYLARQIGADVSQVEAVHGSGNGINSDDLTPFTSLATGRLSSLTGFIPPQPFDVLQEVFGGEIAAARQLMAANAG